MQSKIIDVDKCYWAAHIRKEKADHGNDFNDYCLIPITDIYHILVSDPPILPHCYICVSVYRSSDVHLTLTIPITTGAHRIPPRHQRYCADISTIVPTSSWRILVLYCLSPASSVSAYIIEIYLRSQRTERVD